MCIQVITDAICTDADLYSDKTLPVLAKQIRNQLVPAQDEGGGPNSVDNLPLSAVEIAIQLILTRTNYGLDAPELGMKVPAAVAVWRWEVKTEYWQWLPKNSQDKALQRQQERIQVCYLITSILFLDIYTATG